MEQNKHNGLEIAGLIFGVISLLLSCILIGGFIGIVGIVLSIIALTKSEGKKGTAIAGITLNGISIIILFFMFGAFLMSDSKEESTISKIEESSISETKQIEESVIETEPVKEIPEEIKEENEEVKNVATVRDYVENKEWKISLLDAKEYDSIDDEFYSDKPEIEGNKFVVLFFEVENVSSEDNHFNMFYFESYIDGYSAETEFFMNNPENFDMLGGDVASGKKMKGYVAYEVTPDWKEIEFSYKNWIGTTDKIATFVVTPENISN